MGQRRQPADIPAFARRMKVGAAGGFEAECAREVGKFSVFGRMMTAGDDFNPLAPQRPERIQQDMQLMGLEIIASGMRNHRHAATGANPSHRVFQRRPLMLNIAGMAAREKTLERGAHIGCMALRYQPACKMGAPHHLLVGGIAVCTFIGPRNAVLRKVGGHASGAIDTTMTDRSQACSQLRMGRVNTEPHDMDRLSTPTH